MRSYGHAAGGGPSPITGGLASPCLRGSCLGEGCLGSSVGSTSLTGGARGNVGLRTTPTTLAAIGRRAVTASGAEKAASKMARRRCITATAILHNGLHAVAVSYGARRRVGLRVCSLGR